MFFKLRQTTIQAKIHFFILAVIVVGIVCSKFLMSLGMMLGGLNLLIAADFKKFKDFILKQDLKYTTASEESLKKLKDIAEKEGFNSDIELEYKSIMEKVTPSIERDLEKNKAQICQMLENEIVSRYYFQKGRTIDSFRNDESIEKAILLMENSLNYNTILKK